MVYAPLGGFARLQSTAAVWSAGFSAKNTFASLAIGGVLAFQARAVMQGPCIFKSECASLIAAVDCMQVMAVAIWHCPR